MQFVQRDETARDVEEADAIAVFRRSVRFTWKLDLRDGRGEPFDDIGGIGGRRRVRRAFERLRVMLEMVRTHDQVR